MIFGALVPFGSQQAKCRFSEPHVYIYIPYIEMDKPSETYMNIMNDEYKYIYIYVYIKLECTQTYMHLCHFCVYMEFKKKSIYIDVPNWHHVV